MLAGLASFMQHPMHKKLYARHLISVGVVLLLLLVLHRLGEVRRTLSPPVVSGKLEAPRSFSSDLLHLRNFRSRRIGLDAL